MKGGKWSVNDGFVLLLAIKMGRRQGGPSRTGV
jgi:hypothetical protein